MTAPTPDEPVQVDPAMVLTRVSQESELGAALVRSATWRVLAEHHAAESASLREQLAARGDGQAPAAPAGDDGGPPA